MSQPRPEIPENLREWFITGVELTALDTHPQKNGPGNLTKMRVAEVQLTLVRQGMPNVSPFTFGDRLQWLAYGQTKAVFAFTHVPWVLKFVPRIRRNAPTFNHPCMHIPFWMI